MASYSPAGYVAAVPMRTFRTLLVEGPADKAVISRLLIELRNRNLLNSDNLKIDTAEDIPSEPGGNRQRVESLHSQIGGSEHFAGLVDREFREFDLAAPSDHEPRHRVVPQNLFWTRGHSVENYFATLDFVVATLEQQHPEHLPANYPTILATAFPSIVRACATITLASLATFYRVDKVRTIDRIELWNVDGNGSVVVDLKVLEGVLVGDRQVDPVDFERFLNFWKYYSPRLLAADVALSQWISHGHLADSHIWCAVAALFRQAGVPHGTATQIAWGKKEAQRRTLNEYWSRTCADTLGEYPQALVEWLRG